MADGSLSLAEQFCLVKRCPAQGRGTTSVSYFISLHYITGKMEFFLALYSKKLRLCLPWKSLWPAGRFVKAGAGNEILHERSDFYSSC